MKQHENKQREITFRGIVLGIILAIILATSNTYLALKIGILTSASIPAAILAMGILRFFKGSNIQEYNMVQTAASAGEAIAGGIVYTIPALIIIHYWTGFSYLHNFLIALTGGVLGILFSIPLRKTLMNDPNLRFPEAQAITKTLELARDNKLGIQGMITGGLLGAVIEFLQSGLQIVASSAQKFFACGKTLIGFGAGFSATLVGAGYLMGFNVGLSLLIGAITGWLVIIPILSGVYHLAGSSGNAASDAMDLWGNYVRFVGIGAMLTAGLWTLITLLKPIGLGIKASCSSLHLFKNKSNAKHEHDLPLFYVLIGIILCSIVTIYLLYQMLPIDNFNLAQFANHEILIASILFILVVGFIFAAICGYFSGLVGVSASPGSSIVIGGLLLVALSLRFLLHANHVALTSNIIMNACAIVIVLISVVTGIACITNDNIQDLKVGHLIGSTPWKQQLMLLIGVISASAVIPLLMQLLYNVYGIGGVMPHPGMDPNKMLAAPVPSVLAMVTKAVFNGALPLQMLLLGAGITTGFIILNALLAKTKFKLSILGIAMGLYFPLSSSMPLFIGSLMALGLKKYATKRNLGEIAQHSSVIMACGIVAGAALMDVLLAIPFAISGNPNMLAISIKPNCLPIILGILSVLLIAKLFYRSIKAR